MILRRNKRMDEPDIAEPKGFDDFDLRLGDMMRGERATMGKSLLDVERELRIRATYIAAIENSDPESFEPPGFIPGYVRSYARYLGMDPEEAYQTFCEESGFSASHGMSAEASSIKKPGLPGRVNTRKDAIASPAMPFAPVSESMLSRVEPAAVGSTLVLVGLIAALGFGGWTVLNEIQQVQVAPVENTPNVLADLYPVDDAFAIAGGGDELGNGYSTVSAKSIDRLYRPEALDLPIMVARDGPISTLDPSRIGTLQPELPETDTVIIPVVALAEGPQEAGPQVVADGPDAVQIVAVRPAWVRVRSADGSVIFEGTMKAGEFFDVPSTEKPASLRAGESGSVYFAINGQVYGPVGERGAVTSDVSLDGAVLVAAYDLADPTLDQDLIQYVAQMQIPLPAQETSDQELAAEQ